MLEAIGVPSVEALFDRQIPEAVRLRRPLDLPAGKPEQEVFAHLRELAARNVSAEDELSFLGAGMYDHYVPALIDMLMERSEFLTPYTPYQPEISQGGLQVMFEYQTAISELTALPVANASVYEGPSAVAAAGYLAKLHNGGRRFVISAGLHPHSIETLRTHAHGFGMEVVEVPLRDGVTDPDAWAEAIDGETQRGDLRPAELLRRCRGRRRAERGREGRGRGAECRGQLLARQPRTALAQEPRTALAQPRRRRWAGRDRAGRPDHARHPRAPRRVRRRRGRRRGPAARQPPGLRRAVVRLLRRARGVPAPDARPNRGGDRGRRRPPRVRP